MLIRGQSALSAGHLLLELQIKELSEKFERSNERPSLYSLMDPAAVIESGRHWSLSLFEDSMGIRGRPWMGPVISCSKLGTENMQRMIHALLTIG